MTKAGDRILAGLREALAVTKGHIPTIAKIKVTPSCGCVFCDLKLAPNQSGMHSSKEGSVACTRAR